MIEAIPKIIQKLVFERAKAPGLNDRKSPCIVNTR